MTGHADFVLIGDGDDAIEEVGDALPEGVGVDVAGDGEAGFGLLDGHGLAGGVVVASDGDGWAGIRQLGLCCGEVPDCVDLVATAGPGPGAEDAEDAHVVFHGGYAGLGAVADEDLEGFDVAVALGALGEHDGGMLFAVDVGGLEDGWAYAEDFDVVFLGEVFHAGEFFDGGVDAAVGYLGVGADVADAVSSQVFEVGVGGGRALAA